MITQKVTFKNDFHGSSTWVKAEVTAKGGLYINNRQIKRIESKLCVKGCKCERNLPRLESLFFDNGAMVLDENGDRKKADNIWTLIDIPFTYAINGYSIYVYSDLFGKICMQPEKHETRKTDLPTLYFDNKKLYIDWFKSMVDPTEKRPIKNVATLIGVIVTANEK